MAHRYRFSDIVISTDELLPELQAAPQEDADVEIAWGAGGEREDVVPFSAWRTASGDEWLTFAEDADGFLLTFAEYAQFHVARDASRVAVRPDPATPLATIRHLLLNQVLPLVLSKRGRLVLHASAISWRGGVVAFIGRSGAGKSTMAAACAAAGAEVVTDDCLVVRKDGARWLAVPCGAGVRLWPQTLDLLGWPHVVSTGMAHFTDKRRVGASSSVIRFTEQTLPISRIIQLSRAGEPEIEGELRGQRAVLALASELFRLDVRDAEESRRQFDAISELATEIPIEGVRRMAPKQAAEAVLCRM